MMPRLPNLETVHVKLSELIMPGADLLKPLQPARYNFILPAKNHTFNDESMSFLNLWHPLIAYGPKNEIVGNIRIFQHLLALSKVDPHKMIPVRKITGPRSYTRDELSQFACRDIVLSATAFTIRQPAPTIYYSCHDYSTFSSDKNPIFVDQTSRTLAKNLGVTVNTLRRLVTESYCNE